MINEGEMRQKNYYKMSKNIFLNTYFFVCVFSCLCFFFYHIVFVRSYFYPPVRSSLPFTPKSKWQGYPPFIDIITTFVHSWASLRRLTLADLPAPLIPLSSAGALVPRKTISEKETNKQCNQPSQLHGWSLARHPSSLRLWEDPPSRRFLKQQVRLLLYVLLL